MPPRTRSTSTRVGCAAGLGVTVLFCACLLRCFGLIRTAKACRRGWDARARGWAALCCAVLCCAVPCMRVALQQRESEHEGGWQAHLGNTLASLSGIVLRECIHASAGCAPLRPPLATHPTATLHCFAGEGELFDFGQECLDRIALSLGANTVAAAAGALLPVRWAAACDGLARVWAGGGRGCGRRVQRCGLLHARMPSAGWSFSVLAARTPAQGLRLMCKSEPLCARRCSWQTVTGRSGTPHSSPLHRWVRAWLCRLPHRRPMAARHAVWLAHAACRLPAGLGAPLAPARLACVARPSHTMIRCLSAQSAQSLTVSHDQGRP